jgi:rRNA processing protein Krr1/Pno1
MNHTDHNTQFLSDLNFEETSFSNLDSLLDENMFNFSDENFQVNQRTPEKKIFSLEIPAFDFDSILETPAKKTRPIHFKTTKLYFDEHEESLDALLDDSQQQLLDKLNQFQFEEPESHSSLKKYQRPVHFKTTTMNDSLLEDEDKISLDIDEYQKEFHFKTELQPVFLTEEEILQEIPSPVAFVENSPCSSSSSPVTSLSSEEEEEILETVVSKKESQISIPNNLHKYCIGTSGSIINKISNETNCNVQFYDNDIVEICGSPNSRKKVIRLLKDCLENVGWFLEQGEWVEHRLIDELWKTYREKANEQLKLRNYCYEQAETATREYNYNLAEEFKETARNYQKKYKEESEIASAKIFHEL